MRRATHIKCAGTWSNKPICTVTLSFADRHRRRIRLMDDAGEAFLLDLSEAAQMADGDGLVLEDGAIIQVLAAQEQVADLSCDDPLDRVRLAWHIGNRHTPIQVLPEGALRIAHDHVLVRMAKGNGAKVVLKQAPFQPESGAYDRKEHTPHDH
ncbi:MAG: urease accessory protein UreE [Magnetovibrio sp.]|nr:urease accessory protein UreE [Magnetovibrio sp.]